MTTDSTPTGRRSRTSGIDRSLQILDLLSARGRPASAYEIAKSIGAPLSTVYTLVDELNERIELLQAEWRSEDLSFAVALANALLAHFEDRTAGGFFFTADDHPAPMQRLKPFSDDALPAGNAAAVLALQRLGHLLGEPRYLEAAARALRAAWPHVSELPYAHDALLDALEEYLEPPELVVLRGPAAELAPWLRAGRADYRPGRLCFAIPDDAANLPGLLAGEQTICMGLTEPDGGSDLPAVKTRAVRNEAGDGWIINGAKMWTTMAHVADWVLLLTRSDPNAGRYQGYTMFMMPMSTPGITVDPV